MVKLLLLSIYLLLGCACYAQQVNNTISKADSTVAAKEDYTDDWAALHHYAVENKQLPQPSLSEKRVVFLGSSIFERWKTSMPDFFNNHPYLNRGISGQISPQLLIRFRQDVIDL